MLASNGTPNPRYNYLVQQKLDGVRLMCDVAPGHVTAWSRTGRRTDVPDCVSDLMWDFAAKLDTTVTFDGEHLPGGRYVLFDLIIGLHTPARERYEQLLLLADKVEVAPLVPDDPAKAEAAGWEGLIYRRDDAVYYQGRTADVLKLKFVDTADVLVTEVGVGGKDAAVIAAIGNDGDLVEVGKCSIYNRGNIQPGQVITIRYTRLSEGDRVIQPVFLKARTGLDETNVDSIDTFSRRVRA